MRSLLYRSSFLAGVKEKPLIRLPSQTTSFLSLAHKHKKARCLSSARPLPLEEEVDIEWRKQQQQQQQHIKALKRKPNKSWKGAFSSTASAEEPTDFSENDPFETISPTTLTYTGDIEMPVTTKLHLVTPEEDTPPGVWPIFRLMVSPQFIPECQDSI